MTWGWQRRQYGVLHAVVVGQMRGADGAAKHEAAQGARDLRLAAVTAHRLDAGVERAVGTLGGVGRERAGDEGRLEHALGLEQTRERQRGRDLRAIEERQPLLGPKRERCELDPGQRVGGRHQFGPERAFADPDQRGGEMRQRREVARGAAGALRRHHRHQPALQARHKMLEHGEADARGALPDARDLKRHSQAHHGLGQRLAHTGRMGQDEIALQRREIRVGDAHRGQLTEAGVDAVHRLVPREDRLDCARAGVDGRSAARIKGDRRAEVDGTPPFKAHRTGADGDRAASHPPLHTRACRGAGPIHATSSARCSTFQMARSQDLPASSVPISVSRPRARAALRVTPRSASGTVSPKKVQAMWAHRRKDRMGEVPGLRSVATAIATPWRRKVSMGGLRVSFST